jgi:hypothetical protein
LSALCTATVPLWKASLLSATLFINGVRADGLRSFDLEDVDVRIDANGDIHITAPQYKVEVEPEPVLPAPSTSAMPAATYWLVTVDDGSTGHVVDVLVNGSLVRKIRSGEEQLILDVGPYLQQGENTVLLVPSAPQGTGRLHIYLGTGSNEAGTVVMDDPSVALTISPQSGGSSARQSSSFTIP